MDDEGRFEHDEEACLSADGCICPCEDCLGRDGF